MDEVWGVAHLAAEHCEELHLLGLGGRGLGEGADQHKSSKRLVAGCLREKWIPHRLQQEDEDVEDEGADARWGVSLAQSNQDV